jgi:hypothetical protein
MLDIVGPLLIRVGVPLTLLRLRWVAVALLRILKRFWPTIQLPQFSSLYLDYLRPLPPAVASYISGISTFLMIVLRLGFAEVQIIYWFQFPIAPLALLLALYAVYLWLHASDRIAMALQSAANGTLLVSSGATAQILNNCRQEARRNWKLFWFAGVLTVTETVFFFFTKCQK